MELNDYMFSIEYVHGSTNGKADALSRQSSFQSSGPRLPMRFFGDEVAGMVKSEIPAVLASLSLNSRHRLLYLIKEHIVKDDRYKKINDGSNDDQLQIREDGILLCKDKIVVPNVDVCKLSVLQLAHVDPIAGHLGIRRTFEMLSREFLLQDASRLVKEFVKSCDLCSRSKTRHHLPYGLLNPLPVPTKPWSDISMDFVGPLPLSGGFDMVLVTVDRFTKMAHFTPTISTLTAKDFVVVFQDNVFRLHGFPSNIVSDRGTLFTSEFWLEVTSLLGIQLLHSTAYHQQTNGQSERVIQCLKDYLRIYINYQQNDWIKYISSAEFAYNNAIHSSTQMSPFRANYNFEFSLGGLQCVSPKLKISKEGGKLKALNSVSQLQEVHAELTQNIETARKNYKLQADKLRMDMPKFRVGSKVWLKTSNLKSDRPSKKLDYKYVGPFMILEQVNELAFKLKLPKTMQVYDVFHVDLLEPYIDNSIPVRLPVPEPPDIVNDSEDSEHEEFIVEKVLDKRLKYKKVEYLVHWKNYTITDRTWEPAANLKNARDLIIEYEQSSTPRFKRSKR